MPAVLPQAPPGSKPKPAEKSQAQKLLDKLGLSRPIDLALHLPLRYEDETRITRLADARDGDVVQIEAEVTHCEVTFKPRRQLRVKWCIPASSWPAVSCRPA